MAAEHRDPGFLDPGVVDCFGDVGFEAPEAGVLGAVRRDGVEGPVAVILQADASVELPGQAADGGAVADLFLIIDIRAPESFDRHAADMLAGFDDDDLLAQLRRLDAGDDPGARTAIDHDVRLMGLGAKRRDEEEGQECEEAHETKPKMEDEGWKIKGRSKSRWKRLAVSGWRLEKTMGKWRLGTGWGEVDI